MAANQARSACIVHWREVQEPRHWRDWPERPLGPHDGLPDRLRAKRKADPVP
jgi:hypothetical protein